MYTVHCTLYTVQLYKIVQDNSEYRARCTVNKVYSKIYIYLKLVFYSLPHIERVVVTLLLTFKPLNLLTLYCKLVIVLIVGNKALITG